QPLGRSRHPNKPGATPLERIHFLQERCPPAKAPTKSAKRMTTSPRIAVCFLAVALACAAPAGDDTKAPDVPRTFRPVAPPTSPDVRGTAFTAVDRFILAAAEAKRRT